MSHGQLGSVIRFLRRTAAPSDEGTDRQLLARFATVGDQDAFALLVQRHGRMVLGVCQRILHDSHDAEDAFQGTFLVLARKAGAAGWHDSVGSWLYAVACRVALKVKVGAARRRQHERQGTEMTPPELDTDSAWRELREVIDTELRHLPEKYRAPLVLCYLEGKTNEEAARELGWTKGTVSGRLARARDLLRGRLARHGIALSGTVLTVALSEKATPAAVPSSLLHSTLEAVIAAPSAGAVSVAAVAAEGVLHSMFLTKLKFAAVLAVTLAVLGTGAGLFTYRSLARGPAERVALLTPLPEEKVTAEPKPRASEPVVKDGMSLTVKPTKLVFDAGEAPQFDLTFKNVSETPKRDFALDLDFSDTQTPRWSYKIQEASGKAVWTAERPPDPPVHQTIETEMTLKMGETLTRGCVLGSPLVFHQQGDDPSRKRGVVDQLPPGKYQLVITWDQRFIKDDNDQHWKSTLTTKPVEFEVSDKPAAVIQNGLAVTVRPAKASFLANEPMEFQIAFRNVSEKPYLLYMPGLVDDWGWRFVVDRTEWGAVPPGRKGTPAPVVVQLAPGQTYTKKAQLEGFKFLILTEKNSPILDHLPPNKYRLRIDITLDADPTQGVKPEHPYWMGKLRTNPVEFEVTGK